MILNRLMDKIYISAVEATDGEKVQEVRIVYNFVGEIELRGHPLFLLKLLLIISIFAIV